MSDAIELKKVSPLEKVEPGDAQPTKRHSPPPSYRDIENKGVSNEAYNGSLEAKHHHKKLEHPDETVITLEDVDTQLDRHTDHSDSDDEEFEIPPPDGVALKIHNTRNAVKRVLKAKKKLFLWTLLAAILILYFVYFGFAMAYEFGSEPSVRLLWVTCLVVGGIIIAVIWKYYGDGILEMCQPCLKVLDKYGAIILWVILALIYIAVLVFIFVDVFTFTKQPYNLVSLGGLVIYVLLCFIFSYSPAHVNWRAVLWGIGIQFILALIILRWDWGFSAFKWLGDQTEAFLSHAIAGSIFLFGELFFQHYFAFAVLPVIVYFSCIVSMLYYLGVMQFIVRKVGWLLQKLMGVTVGESINAAGNIFIGQTEAPLLIRPLIGDMTRSEIHSVMTGGFATIAGTVLAAYISFGVPANHLISASVMSAPAALAMSKLFYPETQRSKTRAEDVQTMEPSPDHNLIQAAANGASQSIRLVANIAANLIAFLSLLQLFNSILCWLGTRLGWTDPCLSFELICSYVFFPLALIMGVELEDCRLVAEFIGVKSFINEFVAYEKLGEVIKNKELLIGHHDNNGTFDPSGSDITMYNFTHPEDGVMHESFLLKKGILQDRSEVIATYALCGFANVGSIGIMLGGLGSLAPHRKKDMSRVVVRAMIAGTVASFMTACIAGLFYKRDLSTTEVYIFDYLSGKII